MTHTLRLCYVYACVQVIYMHTVMYIFVDMLSSGFANKQLWMGSRH